MGVQPSPRRAGPGPVGVAVLGTVFFSAASGHDFTGAAQWTMAIAALALALAPAMAFLLPRKARAEGGH